MVKKKPQNAGSGLCWKQGNLIVPLITLLHFITFKYKVLINGAFHRSNFTVLVGGLYISSPDPVTFPLCPTPREEASTEHCHVDWHLQALRAIFTTATFRYLSCDVGMVAKQFFETMTKLLGNFGPFVVTPSLSLLAGTGLATSASLRFHPDFSAKSSQLPPLFSVSLLSDSHTDFAFASMALWVHCRGMRETQREVNSSKQFGYNTRSFLVWQNTKCFCCTWFQERLSCYWQSKKAMLFRRDVLTDPTLQPSSHSARSEKTTRCYTVRLTAYTGNSGIT